jgi:hypothetical protein
MVTCLMTFDTSLDSVFRKVAGLSDEELELELGALARRDHRLTAELLVHLSEVDARHLHAARAYSSLFGYVVGSLGFSEDEAYKRITAARVVRRFPAALDLVSDGRLHLSGLLAVAPHLTDENHQELLGSACSKTKRQVEQLVAERFPRPDVPASIRKLPTAPADAAGTSRAARQTVSALAPRADAVPPAGARAPESSPMAAEGGPMAPLNHREGPVVQATPLPGANEITASESRTGAIPATAVPARRIDHPRIEPLAPERYRITFSAGVELVRKLERAQALASHAVLPQDVAAVFERALDALIAREQKRRYATKPGPSRPRIVHGRAEPATPPEALPLETGASDPPEVLAPERASPGPSGSSCPAATEASPRGARRSRYVPAGVRRAVLARDGGRCTYVDPATGRRCDERRFLEFEHTEPHAFGGPSTEANLRIVCHAHNALLARRVFGRQYVAAVVSRCGAEHGRRRRRP